MDVVRINLAATRVLMTVWYRRTTKQAAAIVGAMLLLNSWDGVPPVQSQMDPHPDTPVITPVPTPVPVPPSPPTAAQEPLGAPKQRSPPLEIRRQVQMALRNYGHYQGPIDGVFGPRTQQAIGSYQVSIGAPPTGELTSQEQAQLLQPPSPAPSPVSNNRGCSGPRF
jgi:peptidoglycan hydrolase-like protein with peptidoglycan-binding domain